MAANPLVLFLRLSRPAFLLGGVLNYALGLGIARYLGLPIDWNLALLGQLWVSSLQLATHYLNEYFDYPGDALNPHRTPFSGGSGVLGGEPGQLRPVVALVAAYCMLTLTALATTSLLLAGVLTPPVVTLMVLAALGAIFYSVPPVRLATTGYGELTTAILLANLVPAFGFALQTGEMHRLLALSTFPLTALTLASMLALEFADYAGDLKAEKQTLLVRMGWQTGVRAHHAFILAGYALFLASFLAGLPAAIVLPPLLSMPLGLLQVWYLGRIADGLRPQWTVLTLNALALTVAAAYLLTYAFWTR
ncbi:MAG: prenyltransferase [Anaerolineales bacterium]|nr:prenyltransferase [Anaerolineales bacterium]